jgi:hypothetical protein
VPSAVNLNNGSRQNCAKPVKKSPEPRGGFLAGAEGGGRRVNEEDKNLLACLPRLFFFCTDNYNNHWTGRSSRCFGGFQSRSPTFKRQPLAKSFQDIAFLPGG